MINSFVDLKLHFIGPDRFLRSIWINQTHICILKQVIVINCQDGLLKSSFPSEENLIYTEKVYFLNTAYLIKHKKKHSGHMKKYHIF